MPYKNPSDRRYRPIKNPKTGVHRIPLSGKEWAEFSERVAKLKLDPHEVLRAMMASFNYSDAYCNIRSSDTTLRNGKVITRHSFPVSITIENPSLEIENGE